MSATPAELEILARICKGEAGIAPYEGKVAVCAVVLNRVRSRRHPDTIRGVAHQPWQFSAYNPNNRARLYWGPIPQACWDAARDALNGWDPSRGATYYFNPYIVLPSWAHSMTRTVRIGTRPSDTHDFYRP
jgi:N-acetylmuramoyl-L-alanine amidase